MEFASFIEMGKDLGLQGQELLEFAKERELAVKQERQIIEDRERDERQSKRAHEKEMKEYELRIAETATKSNSSSTGTSSFSSKLPKLPVFKDNIDDMDSYLLRFERFAEDAEWPRGSWATSLGALLTGRALDVYSRMPGTKAKKYDDLKSALLFKYRLTADGFRGKFRNSKCESGETNCQFLDRMKGYLTRWIELSDTEKTYDGIIDLLLKEQLLNSSSKELSIFLKERNPKLASSMAKLADTYMEAHAVYDKQGKKRQNFNYRPFKKGQPNQKEPTEGQPAKGEQAKAKPKDPRACFVCGKSGHIARDCWHREKNDRGAAGVLNDNNASEEQVIVKHGDSTVACLVQDKLCDCNDHNEYVELSCGHKLPIVTAACKADGKGTVGNRVLNTGMPVTRGQIGDRLVDVLRDSGCSTVVVKNGLVRSDQYLGIKKRCILLDGTVRIVPVAKLYVSTPFYEGEVEALCMENPIYDLILGNITGCRDPNDVNANWKPTLRKEGTVETKFDRTKEEHVSDCANPASAVETRAQKVKRRQNLKPLKVTADLQLGEGHAEVKEAQEKDPSLSKLWNLAERGVVKFSRTGSQTKFVVKNGWLYREFMSPKVDNGKLFSQLVVPEFYRPKVLKLAHDSIMAGHLRVKKTLDRIMLNFYWPGVQAEVKRYCISCDVCQTVTKGCKVPLGTMPLIDIPFKRVAVDLVGPLQPVTDKGNRYILTLVDYATRYPEAVALPRIETERVAEALLEIFSRIGVPEEILSDLGTQFTSDLMKEIARLLSLKQLHTSPYHPICNGLVEKFNGTLKRMLRRMCKERPRDWDRYLPALLFAYREVPQESLGFSPFELLYGRSVRGPLGILKELWTGENMSEEVKTTYQYILDLRERLDATCRIAQEELARSSQRYRRYYNVRARDRKFKVDDEVLLLLPSENNKLTMQWKGPFKVVGKVAHNDYKVNINGKEKTIHANLLKKYVSRVDDECDSHKANGIEVIDDEQEIGASLKGHIGVVEESEVENSGLKVHLLPIEQKESLTDVNISPERSEKEKLEITQILEKYSDVLTDLPGLTHLAYHAINLTTEIPVRSKAYPTPLATQITIKEEVETMLKMEVIEKSESPYASPIVLVRKPDGSNRFCVDFRKLNKITVFDPEPIPNPDELMRKLANSMYFTKIDLSKGYWQIPVQKDDRPKTAFITSHGLYQFKVLPFGLVNAPAAFTRMMRKLLEGELNVINYIDDILIHTESWEEHLSTLESIFLRLRNAGLTARPSKCFIGCKSLVFLGHIVGEGIIKPLPDKITKISNASRPTTKKEVRSFVGLSNYYRKFIPNFAALAAPLTDLTKARGTREVKWGPPQQRAFDTLKERLSSSPILHLPDPSKTFILKTDASDIGLGAVLMQRDADQCFPIYYASRKLLPRERNYAVIERECLALVWAISKFHVYLYGKEFILETDHHPLAYLSTAKMNNSRVMRWALSLQPYRYTVHAVKGIDNVVADYLSRCIQVEVPNSKADEPK
ncbi:hypothetical protein HOLleu_11669 [Holothuria leucospilota]|uniref:Reverse transcriptase n=1 Tax=Holothuria leucospilota TaxID=206669 RepID=A0A9Q1CGM1_HOLLE|nr:hypothetical protein HOLleu_11669 [Holothuria leucospilota]